jgi:hypothetical protein
MSHWGTRVSLELVGQGAAGFSFDTLAIDGKPNLYGEDMKQGLWAYPVYFSTREAPSIFSSVALSTSASRLGMKYLLPLVASLRTPGFNRFLLNLVPVKTVGVVQKFIWELDGTSKKLFAMKKQALLQGNGDLHGQEAQGKDLMTSLSEWQPY